MTHFKIEVRSLCKGVSKILTAYRILKIIFSFYHHKKQIRSFPTMYDTWGCSLVKMGKTKYFLTKSGLKTLILAVMVLDHLTHNFKGIANFHRWFEKLERQLRNELWARRQTSILSDRRPLEIFSARA